MVKILTLDIETQRAIAEMWDPYPHYTPMDRMLVPPRVLCFAAKFYDKKKTHFHAAWDDHDADSYEAMVREAWILLNDADVVIGWNSDRFDIQYLNAAFIRTGLGPPAPFRSLDLIKVVRKHFAKGEPYKKLDWYSKELLGDRKVKHSATDLWEDIRWGTDEEKLAAQKLMKKYNIHDVTLTEQLFEKFRPWTGVNFTIFDPEFDAEGRLAGCTKCGSEKLHSRGRFYTTAYAYERFYCTACRGWNRGRKMIYSTELRPV